MFSKHKSSYWKKFSLALAVFLIPAFILSGCSSGNSGTSNYNIKDAEDDAFYVGLNPNRDYLILVNNAHEYDFGDIYNTGLLPDIVYVSDSDGVPTPVEKGANTALSLLKQHLRAEYGIEIELYSAYRTRSDQQWVYDTYNDPSINNVAKPGFSEHHTGLLLDIVVWWPSEDDPDQYVWTTETAERQANDPGFNVIRESLADFGFIERYPAGKGDITGIQCEPNEIRFVGSSKIAHEIMDNDLCLEEYLANLSK